MADKKQPQIIIKQPDIQIPDKNDRLKWVKWHDVKTLWLRNVGPQMGLSEQMLVLGNALAEIIENDINAFPTKEYDTVVFSKDVHGFAKDLIYAKMDKEITLAELPQMFKNKLLSVKEEMQRLDWSTSEGVAKARAFWNSEIRDYIRTQTYSTTKLYDAMLYYKDNWSLLLEKLYKKFLQHYGME